MTDTELEDSGCLRSGEDREGRGTDRRPASVTA